MANLYQQKSNVFGTISAFKTLLNDYPTFSVGSLLPSIVCQIINLILLLIYLLF